MTTDDMYAILQEDSRRLEVFGDGLGAGGAWIGDKLVALLVILWGALTVALDLLLSLLKNPASLSLLVAGASLFVAMRAFQHDRQVGSLSGLSINTHSPFTNVPAVESGHRIEKRTPYFVIELLARGPGVRYGVQGAVWAPPDTVVTKVDKPQLQVWRSGDQPIKITILRDEEHKGQWPDVYVGAVWERPGGWRNGFVTEGVRKRLPYPGSQERDKQWQTWRPRPWWKRWSQQPGRWVNRKSLRAVGPGPLHGAVDEGQTLADRSIERNPSDPHSIEQLKEEFRKADLSMVGDNDDGATPEGLRLLGEES